MCICPSCGLCLRSREPWRGVAGGGEEGRRWREGLEARTGDGLRVRREHEEPRAASASRGKYFLGSWRHPTRMCASLISSSPSAHPHPTSLTIHVLQTEAEASKAQGLHQVLRTKKGMPGQPQGHTCEQGYMAIWAPVSWACVAPREWKSRVCEASELGLRVCEPVSCSSADRQKGITSGPRSTSRELGLEGTQHRGEASNPQSPYSAEFLFDLAPPLPPPLPPTASLLREPWVRNPRNLQGSLHWHKL